MNIQGELDPPGRNCESRVELSLTCRPRQMQTHGAQKSRKIQKLTGLGFWLGVCGIERETAERALHFRQVSGAEEGLKEARLGLSNLTRPESRRSASRSLMESQCSCMLVNIYD
jgi:hypothetical protein